MAQLSKNTTIGGKSLLDYIYPVGTIYHTEDDSFNPSEYWGGVWEKLKGVFILGADDTNRTESGLTGGEETHTLEKVKFLMLQVVLHFMEQEAMELQYKV